MAVGCSVNEQLHRGLPHSSQGFLHLQAIKHVLSISHPAGSLRSHRTAHNSSTKTKR
ncbi:hypothetical protein P389DRAFT_174707, partial [Cystobasidium minutum MCA 4210]|uniref:uncharacterized protein n=1 Tax=Cystobasidium minutum MCA 4210 TaxID=1397322 RepID=UPI0034CFBB38|eukprot:jgi/Rhomi1/174707/fgenesh1_kg.8_\